MNQEGIFRINGSTKAVDKMKAKFDKSQDAELCDAGDIMAVAGLLKLFLRELPDPLMTEALHEQFISLQKSKFPFRFFNLWWVPAIQVQQITDEVILTGFKRLSGSQDFLRVGMPCGLSWFCFPN